MIRSVRSLVIRGEEGHENHLVGSLELVECGGGREERDGGHGLLGHVRDNGVCFPCTRVGGDVLGAAEDLEGGVSLDAIALAEF